MTVRDAMPMDLYTDAKGKLWRCIATCAEPTVHFVEVEPDDGEEQNRKSGGVSRQMWQGFKRIYRPSPPEPTSETGEA